MSSGVLGSPCACTHAKWFSSDPPANTAASNAFGSIFRKSISCLSVAHPNFVDESGQVSDTPEKRFGTARVGWSTHGWNLKADEDKV